MGFVHRGVIGAPELRSAQGASAVGCPEADQRFANGSRLRGAAWRTLRRRHESLPGRNERRIQINLSNSTLTASLRRGEDRRTSDTPSRSRDALRPSNSSSLTLKWRAQGMPGAKPAPIASRANEKSTRAKSLQVKPFNRHSLRDGFTVSFVLSPGNRAFLPPSPVGSSPTGLMSASRHQDHTTSPSALPAFVFASRSVHRIPRSTLVTIA